MNGRRVWNWLLLGIFLLTTAGVAQAGEGKRSWLRFWGYGWGDGYHVRARPQYGWTLVPPPHARHDAEPLPPAAPALPTIPR